MDIRLDGQTVVVTGAGGGIGRAHALLLAEHGARVVVNDIGGDVHGQGTGTRPADEVVAEISDAGGEAVASYDSVATPEGGQAIIDTAVEAFGRIDAVVHNAGILRDRSFANLTPDELESVLDVHLRGGFHVVQPAFRLMKEQGYGRIVLTASASGLLGNFGQSNYGAAKMGLVGLANVIALEGAKHDIKVNVIAPSARTRMTEDLLGPLAGALDPVHVAPLVTYLCSSACEPTHEIFSVGGGRYARVFIGVAPGWFHGPEPATPSQVADHLQEIRDLEGYTVPTSGADEVQLLLAALKSGT